MKIGQDIENVIELMNVYSENSLRKAQDVAVIMELAARSDKAESINLILLYSSSLWNLYQTVQRQTQKNQILHNELLRSSMELSKSITSIAEEAEEEYVKSRFAQLYCGDGKGVLMNLIDLSYDFSVLKKIQTEVKSTKTKH